jgi:hypothetical protein
MRNSVIDGADTVSSFVPVHELEKYQVVSGD